MGNAKFETIYAVIDLGTFKYGINIFFIKKNKIFFYTLYYFIFNICPFKKIFMNFCASISYKVNTSKNSSLK